MGNMVLSDYIFEIFNWFLKINLLNIELVGKTFLILFGIVVFYLQNRLSSLLSVKRIYNNMVDRITRFDNFAALYNTNNTSDDPGGYIKYVEDVINKIETEIESFHLMDNILKIREKLVEYKFSDIDGRKEIVLNIDCTVKILTKIDSFYVLKYLFK